eukprot:359531-Chlamydomonas_euryale.AAC.5
MRTWGALFKFACAQIGPEPPRPPSPFTYPCIPQTANLLSQYTSLGLRRPAKLPPPIHISLPSPICKPAQIQGPDNQSSPPPAVPLLSLLQKRPPNPRARRDLTTGSLIAELAVGGTSTCVEAIACSPDGTVAVGAGQGDTLVRLWDLARQGTFGGVVLGDGKVWGLAGVCTPVTLTLTLSMFWSRITVSEAAVQHLARCAVPL